MITFNYHITEAIKNNRSCFFGYSESFGEAFLNGTSLSDSNLGTSAHKRLMRCCLLPVI